MKFRGGEVIIELFQVLEDPEEGNIIFPVFEMFSELNDMPSEFTGVALEC